MTDFMDVGQFHENNRTGKWRFQKLGYAKPNEKGGWDIYLDALPIPTDGQVRMVISQRRDSRDGYQNASKGGGTSADNINDEIPF